jgi:hypothetical protein
MQLICFLAFFLLISVTLAALVNVTIDDYLGDLKTGTNITYLPEGAWNYGPECHGCTARPDIKQISNGTVQSSIYDTGNFRLILSLRYLARWDVCELVV